tara:strand:- start:270 stop:542 length:273 start_codon:yes stop_codon:yes gene_type:complete
MPDGKGTYGTKRGRPKKLQTKMDESPEQDVPTASKTKARPKTGAKPKASAGKPTGAWMAHVKKTHIAGKKKDPSYSYKSAMADAKKTYKK